MDARTAIEPARAPGGLPALGLYVHIPFCETKCPYCDFNTYSGIESLIPAYMSALEAEITRWAGLLESPRIKTVFFGGGTPSYVPPERLAGICNAYRSGFQLASDAEVTIEVNPGDVTEGRLASWLDMGINRLSMGVQSFDDRLLQMLGRRHSAAQAREAFGLAGRSGFSSTSLDLMFGLPKQTLGQWTSSVSEALALRPQHLSLYGLQLEHGTPLEAAVRTGRIPEPDEDLAADMYLVAEDMLDDAGFRRYEISNWARPGHESHHNLLYWRLSPYLGVGPGAHSLLGATHFANMKSPRQYTTAVIEQNNPLLTGRPRESGVAGFPGLEAAAIAAIEEMHFRGPVESVETVSEETFMGEYLMMGLRLDAGVSFSEFEARFGADMNRLFGSVIAECSKSGLLESVAGCLRLTAGGRLLGNHVFRQFVAAAGAMAPGR